MGMFPHVAHHQEMLKHQIDMVLFWAFAIFFPGACDVSESTFFYSEI